jgi:glycosyltransferase involved in cell wall biosynthesis
MRIALYHELPSGGGKKHMFEVARRLAQHHVVDAYTLSSANHGFCDLRPSTRHHRIIAFEPSPLFKSPFGRLNQVQRWRDLRRLDHLSRRTAAEIDSRGYDVVYVHSSLYTQAPDVLRYLVTPSVYQANEALRLVYEPDIVRPYHNQGRRAHFDRFDPFIQLYRRQLRMADRRNILRATRLLTNSRYTAKNLERIYGRPATVSYPGIDLNEFHLPKIPDREQFVLSVGALRPNKGFDFLIAALACLPAHERPPLRLVGNADDRLERKYLEHLAIDKGVDLTIETGLDKATLVQRYHQAQLVLYAPVREPLGFVPLEAMACETPVVAVAEGGVLETIIPNVTGILVPRDPEEFANAVHALCLDQARQEQLVRAGLKQVTSEWNWARTLSTVEAALFDVAGGHN